MSNRRDIQFMYNPHNKATVLDCSFKVAAGDASGSGISGLNKSGRIASVFMNSSANFSGDTHSNTTVDNIADTSALVVGMLVTGSGIAADTTIAAITSSTAITLSQAATATASGVTITYASVGSPQPQSGVIMVNLQDNYNRFLGADALFAVALSGSSVNVDASDAALTVGDVYVITSLGTSTTADWHSVGVPAGITPAVGVAFIALVTGSGAGTGTVQAPAASASGVFSAQLIGNPGLANSNGAQVLGAGQGMQIIFGCYKDSSSDAPVLAAPSDGSFIYLFIYLNNSAQGV